SAPRPLFQRASSRRPRMSGSGSAARPTTFAAVSPPSALPSTPAPGERDGDASRWAIADEHEPVSSASAPSRPEVLIRTSIAALALLLTAGPAFAQGSSDFSSTASGVIGIGKTYDDEGGIGAGPLFGARIDRRLFGNTFLEASLDNLGHDRSDRFVANG